MRCEMMVLVRIVSGTKADVHAHVCEPLQFHWILSNFLHWSADVICCFCYIGWMNLWWEMMMMMMVMVTAKVRT